MAGNDIFAPPTKEELSAVSDPFSAPPSKAELTSHAKPHGDEVEAFGTGLSNIASGGYLPQIVGGASSAAVKLQNLYDKYINDYDGPTADSSYTKFRDQAIKHQDKLYAENPLSYGAGAVTGGIASSLLLPGANLAKGADLAKAASLGQKARAAAKVGGAYGFLQNPGDVEGEVSPLQLLDRSINGGLGAGFGAAGAALGHGVDKGASYIGNKLSGVAEDKAFKALGPYSKEARLAVDKGTVDRTGRTLLDEGVFSGLGPKSYEEIGQRAANVADTKGAKIGDYLGELSQAAQAAEAGGQSGLSVSRKAVADQARKDLLNPNKELPGVAQANKKIEQMLNTFENGSMESLPVNEAELLKRSVGKEINWDRMKGQDIPLQEQVSRSLYGGLKGGVENTANTIEAQTGSKTPGMFNN